MGDTFWQALRQINTDRCEKCFHSIDGWTAEMWAMAAFGELGESVNEIKKLVRGDGDPRKCGLEIADVIVYCDLMLARVRIDLSGIGYLSTDSLASVGKSIDYLDAGQRLMAVGKDLHQVVWMKGDPLAALNAAGQALCAAGSVCQLLKLNVLDLVTEKFDVVSARRGYPVLFATALQAANVAAVRAAQPVTEVPKRRKAVRA